MFGYVSQERFDQERDARLRAEAREETLREELREERVRVTDLLERIAPKPAALTGFTGTGEAPRRLSVEEILTIPAVGRRGIKQRNTAAAHARKREEKESDEQDASSRKATLTPEEQRSVDEAVVGK